MQRKTGKRSFTGCDQCKRRHQKCDEAKPTCTRCISTGARCSYSYKLSWGGREFDKSCFGICLQKNKVSKIRTGTGSFIYAATRDRRSPYSSEFSMPGALNSEFVGTLSNMTPTHRSLLEFFLCETSRIISCHQGVWDNLCRTMIPMAMEYPYLMSAVLALSGNYYISSGASSSHTDATLTAQLRNSSIAGLRSAFNASTPVTEAVLATAMLLCLSDIHSGIDATSSWRIHFQGAQAIMATLGHSAAILESENQDSSWRLLAQMYTSIELIASLTVKGLPNGQRSKLAGDGNFIDEYFGISMELLDTLYAIGAAASERRRIDRDADRLTMQSYKDLLQQADSLEQTVRSMMAWSPLASTPFHPCMENRLSPEEKQQYLLCNEAYQHTALINIHRRIRSLPGSRDILASAQRILDIAGQMEPTSGLSPWLLMATPLFTAGSEASLSDRDRTRSLLGKLHDTIRITNYQSLLALLEIYWEKSDEGCVQNIESILGM
ncbi:Zn(II)2Cys6 transcription factor [Aspergillus lucknowensis]|uniref:Fungal-specific transcription factor domain-containing protein n=1 Tax=Aspergillus lucknowensis TaxID=176173 RepID=A0ABR4LNP1_9EURO